MLININTLSCNIINVPKYKKKNTLQILILKLLKMNITGYQTLMIIMLKK